MAAAGPLDLTARPVGAIEAGDPACLVIRTDGERITRIDEHLDPTVTAALG